MIQHLLEKYSHETTKRVDQVICLATELLMPYNWPGMWGSLRMPLKGGGVPCKSRSPGVEYFSFLRTSLMTISRPRSLREMERGYIQQILEENDWNITRDSQVLGMNRVTLHKMIKRYKLGRKG